MIDSRSQQAVADFFSPLLDEPASHQNLTKTALEKKPLAQLLAKVTEVAPTIEIDQSLVATVSEPEVTVQTAVKIAPLSNNPLKDQMASQFPVLYFRVGPITMAVPLVKLRGIYPLKKVTKLIGKPDWFYGVQIERGQNISVIDTAKYIMREKINSELEKSLNYQYIIILGVSNWGLLWEELIDSSALNHQDIKWRSGIAKSPWLAGTVKQRMCGLLAVDALTQLLENN